MLTRQEIEFHVKTTRSLERLAAAMERIGKTLDAIENDLKGYTISDATSEKGDAQ